MVGRSPLHAFGALFAALALSGSAAQAQAPVDPADGVAVAPVPDPAPDSAPDGDTGVEPSSEPDDGNNDDDNDDDDGTNEDDDIPDLDVDDDTLEALRGDPPKAPTSPLPGPPTTTTSPEGTRSTTTRPGIRLVYSPGIHAAQCPDVDAVKDRIVGLLRRDPFVEPASQILLLLIDGDGDAPSRARVELLDANLRPLGSRLVEAREDCAELVATAALQISIALDPLDHDDPAATTPAAIAIPVDEAGGPTAPPMPGGASSAEDDLVADLTDLSPRTEVPVLDEMRPLFSMAGHIAGLLTPDSPMFGIAFGVGGRWDLWSLRAEGRLDISGDDRGINTFPMVVSAVPCVHLPIFDLESDGDVEVSGCATASGGIIPAFGNGIGLGVYAGAGGRAGIDWRFDETSAARLYLQLEAGLLRPTFQTSSETTYTTPPVNFLVGGAVDVPSF